MQKSDSDDWLTADATKLMVRAAEETGCDMVIADFYRVVGEMVSRKGDIDADQVIGREAFVGFMMENPADYYYGVLWNKLYRRSPMMGSLWINTGPETSGEISGVGGIEA